MKRTKKSFSTRLSLNILLIVSILFITALVAASVFSHRLISREAMKSADNLLHATISDIEKVTLSIETMTRDAAGICYARPNDDNLIRQIETSVLRGSPYIKCSTVSFRPGYLPGKKKHAPMSWIDSDSGEIKFKELGNKVIDVSREIDDKIARRMLAAWGIAIDELTEEQEKYLHSWQV